VRGVLLVHQDYVVWLATLGHTDHEVKGVRKENQVIKVKKEIQVIKV
jgi:hypothetical protein